MAGEKPIIMEVDSAGTVDGEGAGEEVGVSGGQKDSGKKKGGR
jgi:hypothetical protein